MHTHIHKISHNVIGALISFAIILLLRKLIINYTKSEDLKELAKNG